MKKKRVENSAERETSAVAEPSGEYVVGQVSSSLWKNKSSSTSDSLSALFKTQPSAPSLLYVPAPLPVPKSTEANSQDKETACSKAERPNLKGKKRKSASEEKVENRESALRNADEDELIKKPARRKAGVPGTADLGGGQEPAKKARIINQAEERIKNKRTVFVGNLPVSCTKKDLKLRVGQKDLREEGYVFPFVFQTLQILFRELGSIESVRFRSVTREDAAMSRKVAAIQRKVHPKRQSINAYVVFKAEDGALKALQRNGMEIEKGFHIRVDLASKATSHDHKRSIFVGNLPYDVKELSVREHFEECGVVEAVRLVRDKNSGMGKGFGYILFQSADAVQLALKLDGSVLLDRKVRVKRSVKKEKTQKPAPGVGPRAVGRGGEQARRKGHFQGRPDQSTQRKRPERRPGKPQARGASFKGEMATPGGGAQKKGMKKKFKPRRREKVPHLG